MKSIRYYIDLITENEQLSELKLTDRPPPNLEPKEIGHGMWSFEFNGHAYGVAVQMTFIQLPSSGRQVNSANIAFGILHDPKRGFVPGNFDLELTGFGNPIPIISAVAKILAGFPELRSADIVACQARGSDKDRKTRMFVYNKAIEELIHLAPEFKFKHIFNNPVSMTAIRSKIELSKDELADVSNTIRKLDNM